MSVSEDDLIIYSDLSRQLPKNPLVLLVYSVCSSDTQEAGPHKVSDMAKSGNGGRTLRLICRLLSNEQISNRLE